MQKFLLTTALVLPLSAGIGWAQTSTDTTAAPPPATTAPSATEAATDAAKDAASTAATKAGEAADAAGDAASKAMDAAGTAAGEAADKAADAASNAADAAGDAAKSAADAAGEAATEAKDAMTPATPAASTDMTTTEPAATDGSVSSPDAVATDAAAAAATPADVVREQAPNELRVDWITGSSVVSPEGESVGTINDLIVDGQTGAMKAAVVGVGGFLGIGEKQIAIDWSKLTVDYDANRITTSITKEEAKAAPAYAFRDRESAPAPVAEPAATESSMPADSATMPAGDAATTTTTTTTTPEGSASTTTTAPAN